MSSLNQNFDETLKQQDTNSGPQKRMDTDVNQSAVNSLGPKSKHSPIVRRDRAHSEPKSSASAAPQRPPPPAHPPPPNPRLNRLITDYHAANSGVHVIDSRSKSKTLPPRRTVTSSAKTTKYGTPPPTRPAPPPPKGIEKEKEKRKGSPMSQNSPIPKPRSLLPRAQPRIDAESANQDPTPTSEALKNVGTKEPAVDQSFPVYEDLDKDDTNNYEKLDPSSSSEDENEPTLNSSPQGGPSTSSDAPPPPLPPKKAGAKIEPRKKEEELPPLPPRALPATTVRKHRLLANQHDDVDKGKDSDQEENEEALQDTGVYEPVIYRDSDVESQKSQG